MGLADLFKKDIVIGDESLAKGFVYAWTAVALADGKISNEELGKLNTFAKATDATKNFYSEQWIAAIFEEAVIIYKQQGMDALIATIGPFFANAESKERQILLYTLMLLGCIDGDFSSSEMGAVKSIVDAIDISREDVLFAGMVFASNK